MTAATDLWTAVVARYPDSALVQLTNLGDRTTATVDTARGQLAAQAVINLWPLYAQAAYDETDAEQVEVATFGVIAVLQRRGGAARELANIRWGEVFGDDGLIAKFRETNARGRPSPMSNADILTSGDRDAGEPQRYGWSDRRSLPPGFLPRRGSRTTDDGVGW